MATSKQKPTGKIARKAGRRLTVVPYVVPQTRSRPEYRPLMIPTRWVKFIIALFLLPLCAALTQTFFTALTHAAVTQRLWMAEPFWFFSLGSLLCLIAFFGLPRPVILYVFGHELTHVLGVLLTGGRVSRFHVGRHGGHIITNRSNVIVALAPYFFPIYSLVIIAVYGVLSIFYEMEPYGRLLYALIGATWTFHFVFTCWMITKKQTDLTDHGTFFSLVLIYLMNLTLLSLMLILASPHFRFADFASDFVRNISNVSHQAVELCERLRHAT